MTTTITPRLRTRYNDEIRAQLKDTLELDNIMLVPKIEKIVLNMGVDAVGQAKLLEGALSDMETIAGQKPVITQAKKSLASFKLREGQAIGTKVTLRGDRMYEFLDRLISLAIPRIRDFRGLPPKSFDGNGNYTFGVTEQLMFPEIDYDRVDTTQGMDITIVTTAKTNEEGKALLDAFNFRSGARGSDPWRKSTHPEAAEDAQVQGASVRVAAGAVVRTRCTASSASAGSAA